MSSLVFVVHQNPCGPSGADDVLGELTEAFDKSIRRAYNAPGEGSFSINMNSTEQFEWCLQGNYVRVYRDSIAGDLIHGFWIETASMELISEDEGGGEIATFAGRGTLAVLERAVLFHESYLDSLAGLEALPQDDPDGMWHWLDEPPGAILVRQLEEAIERATIDPQGLSAIEPVTWDFTRNLDSNGDGWENPVGDKMKLAVGMNLMDVLEAFQDIGLIVEMTPDFELHAWDTDQGDDVHATVGFTKGNNIRPGASLQMDAPTVASTVLVQGDLEDPGVFTYVIRTDDDAGVDVESDYGRIERFKEYHYTPTTAKLNKKGDIALRRSAIVLVGPTTLGVVEESPTGTLIAFQDYRQGDTVNTDIADRKIAAIGLFDRDNGEYDPVIEFESGAPMEQVVTYLMGG